PVEYSAAVATAVAAKGAVRDGWVAGDVEHPAAAGTPVAGKGAVGDGRLAGAVVHSAPAQGCPIPGEGAVAYLGAAVGVVHPAAKFVRATVLESKPCDPGGRAQPSGRYAASSRAVRVHRIDDGGVRSGSQNVEVLVPSQRFAIETREDDN